MNRESRKHDRLTPFGLVTLVLLAFTLGILTDYAVVLNSRAADTSAATLTTGIGAAGDSWSVRLWRGTRRNVLNASFAQPSVRSALPQEEAASHIPHSSWRSAYRRVQQNPSISRAFINGQAYGWPMRSWSGFFINATPTGSTSAWLEVPWRSSTELLPYLPIFPGVVVNTVLFAAAWTALLLLARGLFPRRHKVGVCAECGYDLQGLAGDKCPECGHHTAARAPATPR